MGSQPLTSTRPRLVSRLRSERIALVEAAGGYGKSLLAAEFRSILGIACVNVEFERPEHDAQDLVTELALGVRRAKLSHLAPVTTIIRDPDDVIDDLLEALGARAEPLLVIVDDAHLLDDGGRRLLMRFAADLPRPHRLLILARGLGGFRRHLRPEQRVCFLTTADLQLSESEIRAILDHGAATPAGDHGAGTIEAATSGWPAAVARCTQANGARVPRARVETAQRDVVADLLQEQLETLDAPSRRAVAQLAHLPWMSRGVVEAVTGLPGLLDDMAVAGLPMLEDQGLRVSFPVPVREHLASLGSLRPSTSTRAATEYVSLGAIDAAVGVLLAAGRSRAAAKLLSELPPHRVEQLSYVELKTTSDLLAPEAVRAHPRVLLHLARGAELALDLRTRRSALRRLEKLAAEGSDTELVRELQAERARDLVRENRLQEAEALAGQILREAGADELRIRARALETLAQIQAHDIWEDASARAAEARFVEVDVLSRWAGETTWAAQALVGLACHVHFARGEIDAMLARVTEALTLVPHGNRYRAVALVTRARGLIYVGRYADAEQDLAEAESIADLHRDDRVLATAALERARIASQSCDSSPTVAHINEAERHLGALGGRDDRARFLADAALLLDRIGDARAADDFLRRAISESSADPRSVALAEALILARRDDPVQAEERFKEIDENLLAPPRERWRMCLFRAHAAVGRGDPSGKQWAVEAFEAAESLGLPMLPLVQEHALAQRLVAAAAEAGSRAAASLPVENLPLTIYLLGRFAVVRGGLEMPLPSGRPQKLVKFLAVRGGRAHVEEAVEALWPNVSPGSGRKRLRNVLNRLRETSSDLVVRQGEMLSLADEVEVDAQLFERDARRALSDDPTQNGRGDALATARSAVARYAGELLPDDVYEPWAAGPRERLRLRCLSLLDLLAAAARARGDGAGELVVLERAMEVDPHDEGRYLGAVESLRAQGKRLAAYSLLLRARAALSAAGLPAPRAFVDLARELQDDIA